MLISSTSVTRAASTRLVLSRNKGYIFNLETFFSYCVSTSLQQISIRKIFMINLFLHFLFSLLENLCSMKGWPWHTCGFVYNFWFTCKKGSVKANRTKKLNTNNIHSIWSGPKQVNYQISWCEYTHNLIKCIYAHGQKHQIIPINKTQLSGGQCIFKNRPLFAFALSIKEPDPTPLAACGTQTQTEH